MVLIPFALASAALVPDILGRIPFFDKAAIVAFLGRELVWQFLKDHALGQHEPQRRDARDCPLPFHEVVNLVFGIVLPCNLTKVEVFNPADGVFAG